MGEATDLCLPKGNKLRRRLLPPDILRQNGLEKSGAKVGEPLLGDDHIRTRVERDEAVGLQGLLLCGVVGLELICAVLDGVYPIELGVEFGSSPLRVV